MKQELSAGLGKGEIAELVKDNEVEAAEVFGELALSPCPPFGLKPVDQIDGVEEAAAGSGPYAAARNRDRQMRLAGTGRTRGILPNITTSMDGSFIDITLATVRTLRS
jgi:hypothetical protein